MIAALAACNSSTVSGGPPVAEWNVAPISREPVGGAGASAVPLSSRNQARAIVATGTGRLIGAGKTRQPAQEPVGEDGVTLNLVDLPISQAAKIVIGDIVGADFVVDPKLDGKVTVHTANPVRKSTALDLFQSALRVSGAAVVKAGDIYKIVPSDQAAVSGEVISGDALPPEATPLGQTARVVQLRYVSASEMKRVLEPIAERGSIVRADDARNTLTINGSAQDIATLLDAVSMFDIDTMKGMSFALVPVRSGDADLLADDLKNVFGSEKEGPMGGMIRFIGNKRLSSILVISSQPQYIARARAWIDKLDARAEHSEKQFFTFRVQNRPAKELMAVLTSVFGSKGQGADPNVSPRFGQSSLSSGGMNGGGMMGGGSGGGASSSPLGALSASGPTGGGSMASGGGAPTGGGPSGGGGFGAGFGGAGGSPSSISGLSVPGDSSGGGQAGPTPAVSLDNDRYKIGVDDAKNALIVMATPEDYRRVRAVIETLDVLPNQIFLEATIAEVRLNDTIRFGVRWFMQTHPNIFGFSGLRGGNPAANDALGNNLLGTNVGAVFPGFAYAFRTTSQQLTIDALNAITDTNIISTPSLMVLDNREAILQVGDQIPVQTLTSVSAIGNTFNSVNYTNTGVILKITPHISESGRVMLEIEQEVSNVDPLSDPTSTTPRIQQRRVRTQVVVNDNESLMLGGLVKAETGKNSSQIPVAGDVPIVGNLFKNHGDSIDKQELIIMLTPHVVRSLSEGREITEEYKRKLLDISSRAVGRPHDIEQSLRRTVLDPWSKSPWRVDKETR
ncbi:type II secretion system secretin GspD [Methylocystis sp. IM3]|uniref:type II secretion system secretin GspD n=1 Tax=unclassified Methylocystis TaxID=2625913 RepID=UPI003119D5EF